jgi:broad specificity phosphatase PhoE
MDRPFLLASALQAQAAARVAAELPTPIDLVVTSPSPLAREAAAIIVGGRWVFTVDEPRLAQRAPGESGDDVFRRLAQALRGLLAFDAKAPLVVLDALDVLGAGVFALDEEGVTHAADALEGLLPLP